MQSVMGAAGVAALPASSRSGFGALAAATTTDWVPAYARLQNYRSRRQSSYDRTGGNADRLHDQGRRYAGVVQRKGRA